MIYACLRFIQEWAHPLTFVNFTLIGLSSGLVLTSALAALAGEAAAAARRRPWALALTLLAWAHAACWRCAATPGCSHQLDAADRRPASARRSWCRSRWA